MITDQDVKKLEKTFVTHKSLKKELEKFATKDDLAVQTERIDSLVYEVGDLKVEVAELRDEMQAGFHDLGHKMDRMLGNFDVLLTDNRAGAEILARHERQILALADHMNVILPG